MTTTATALTKAGRAKRRPSETPPANGIKNADLPQLTEAAQVKSLPPSTVVRDRDDRAFHVRRNEDGHTTLQRIGGRDHEQITAQFMRSQGPFALVFLPGHFLADSPWLQERDANTWHDGADAALVSEGYVDPSECAVLKTNPHKGKRR